MAKIVLTGVFIYIVWAMYKQTQTGKTEES
jgi:hypothetical protein